MQKTKFNIISCIILSIIVISLGSTLWEGRHDFIRGFKKGYGDARSEEVSSKKQVMYVEIHQTSDEATAPTLFNSKNQTETSFEPIQVRMFSNTEDINPYMLTANFLIVFALFISFIVALVFFIKFILSVNKQKYFEEKNVHYLKIVGRALLISGVLEFMFSYLEYNMNTQAFQFEGYSITFDSGNSYLNIILGLSALLISQFVKMGLIMKEEQELTI